MTVGMELKSRNTSHAEYAELGIWAGRFPGGGITTRRLVVRQGEKGGVKKRGKVGSDTCVIKSFPKDGKGAFLVAQW